MKRILTLAILALGPEYAAAAHENINCGDYDRQSCSEAAMKGKCKWDPLGGAKQEGYCTKWSNALTPAPIVKSRPGSFTKTKTVQ